MEVDLLVNYPKAKRDISQRGATKTDEDRAIARKFEKEFFDGERRHGYGGFHYHSRFWSPVIPTFQQHYGLTASSKVLDVGCAKGFMLYDLVQAIPGITVAGVDVSSYAIENGHPAVQPYLSRASATDLPFPDKSFDLVISINTLHNLEGKELERAFKEVSRVSKRHAFITVDAYRNEEEKQLMYAWNLTAKTIMHVDDWKSYFDRVGYKGDYYWFMP